MKIAVDTNRYSDLIRYVPETVEIFANAEAIFLPFVVVAELQYGFSKGTKPIENKKLFERFISETAATILWPTPSTLDQFSSLKLQLRLQGTPIPDHDIWIAALSLEHQLPLYTRDTHFDHLPQLQRI